MAKSLTSASLDPVHPPAIHDASVIFVMVKRFPARLTSLDDKPTPIRWAYLPVAEDVGCHEGLRRNELKDETRIATPHRIPMVRGPDPARAICLICKSFRRLPENQALVSVTHTPTQQAGSCSGCQLEMEDNYRR